MVELAMKPHYGIVNKCRPTSYRQICHKKNFKMKEPDEGAKKGKWDVFDDRMCGVDFCILRRHLDRCFALSMCDDRGEEQEDGQNDFFMVTSLFCMNDKMYCHVKLQKNYFTTILWRLFFFREAF